MFPGPLSCQVIRGAPGIHYLQSRSRCGSAKLAQGRNMWQRQNIFLSITNSRGSKAPVLTLINSANLSFPNMKPHMKESWKHIAWDGVVAHNSLENAGRRGYLSTDTVLWRWLPWVDLIITICPEDTWGVEDLWMGRCRSFSCLGSAAPSNVN